MFINKPTLNKYLVCLLWKYLRMAWAADSLVETAAVKSYTWLSGYFHMLNKTIRTIKREEGKKRQRTMNFRQQNQKKARSVAFWYSVCMVNTRTVRKSWQLSKMLTHHHVHQPTVPCLLAKVLTLTAPYLHCSETPLWLLTDLMLPSQPISWLFKILLYLSHLPNWLL